MNRDLVYLIQTDTTVGFSSFDDERLSNIKQRPSNQKILKTVDSFSTLQEFTRVPKKYRKMVRNSRKTTFIYPNLSSFRVVDKDCDFFGFISKFKILSSTSANLTKNRFDYNFAFSSCNVEVVNKDGFFETNSSKIFKLGNKKILKIR